MKDPISDKNIASCNVFHFLWPISLAKTISLEQNVASKFFLCHFAIAYKVSWRYLECFHIACEYCIVGETVLDISLYWGCEESTMCNNNELFHYMSNKKRTKVLFPEEIMVSSSHCLRLYHSMNRIHFK